MKINLNSKVEEKYNSYPDDIRPKIENLRAIIMEAAKELNIEEIEETLKWGEPSFLVKNGSTIRMDWKAKKPTQYAMYFKCTSKLVATFKEVYGDTFRYEGNRAIVFQLTDKVLEAALKECIKAGLRYHSVKNEKLLGMV